MQISANGIKVNCELAGPAGAPVVALSHSLASSRRMWKPQLPSLTTKYRVLNMDTRGHGGTEAPDGPYSLDMLADDALGVLDALEIDQVHWVGLSMGGMIGQNLGLRAPDRLASLTLSNTTSRVPAEAKPMWDERIATARNDGMAALAEPTLERWFTPSYFNENGDGVALIRSEILSTPVAGYVGCCQAISTLDYTDRLGEIKTPTLVIAGEDDPSTTVEAAETIKNGIADAQLAVIGDARHIANVEQAAIYTETLMGFLKAH